MAERNKTEQQTGSQYLREFLPAVLSYSVALLLVILAVDFDSAGWWKYPVALVPVAPAIWGTVAITRHAARVDEMQRSLVLEGVAVGFGVAMITALTLGFLAMAGLDTNRWGAWLIYSIGMLGWIAGQTRARLRRS